MIYRLKPSRFRVRNMAHELGQWLPIDYRQQQVAFLFLSCRFDAEGHFEFRSIDAAEDRQTGGRSGNAELFFRAQANFSK
jgi:hypothetical protein